MKSSILAGIILTAIISTSALGSGMLIPKDGSIPPLSIKHQRVDIRIKDGVAIARMEQVFKNSVNRDLEAVYIFPLPENASISDFAMYINGKRMSGELVEKDKARKIYQDIVRRLKDPGLLEHMGGKLFRVSVYPVPKNGEQKIELEYSQQLDFEAGLYKYVYPLRTGERASKTLDDFTVSVRLLSTLPIKTVYSPSHKVGINRKGENEAVIGFEEEQAVLDKDFMLYYGVSKKEFGLNLLTHAVNGQDGFFMMMLAPAVMPQDSKVTKKDVTFVFDTSGSMAGKKMEQARKALEYCVRKLNDGDRFNIVRFSTDVELFKETLVEVTSDTRNAALEFIGKLEARGGTDINGALAAALSMKYDTGRPNMIAFLTDGKPTIGDTDMESIVSNVDKKNADDTRIFVFGVGEQVNTHLLDRISVDSSGLSQYVTPDEDIEVKLSSFSDKMSHPVLARLAIAVDKIKVRQMHPRALPDLFCGDQVTILGRYKGDGHVAIRLTGEVDGKKREFVYEGTFPVANVENEFVPRLWATRRVGYLLDEIRLHGEQAELKDEVLKLSKEYGIMTPYTSYLVLEDDKAYETHGIARRTGRGGPPAVSSSETATRHWAKSGPVAIGGAAGGRKGAEAEEAPAAQPVPVFDAAQSADFYRALPEKRQVRRRIVRVQKKEVNGYLDQQSGGDAIELSKAIHDYKQTDRVDQDQAAVRHVGNKVFYLVDGQWIDSSYRKHLKTIKVKFAGDEYFKLLTDKPGLKQYFALGAQVIVVLPDDTAVIVE